MELVNAKLIERGLEDVRPRHTRLGMPLYDVEQLKLHPNKENANVPHGPEATNLTLAMLEKMKVAPAASETESNASTDFVQLQI